MLTTVRTAAYHMPPHVTCLEDLYSVYRPATNSLCPYQMRANATVQWYHSSLILAAPRPRQSASSWFAIAQYCLSSRRQTPPLLDSLLSDPSRFRIKAKIGGVLPLITGAFETASLCIIAVSDISQRLLPTIISGTAGIVSPETIVGTAYCAVVAAWVIFESLRPLSSSPWSPRRNRLIIFQL